eukprot:m51a1_g1127 hypothetical protein (728) ;mRNA; r:193479-196153
MVATRSAAEQLSAARLLALFGFALVRCSAGAAAPAAAALELSAPQMSSAALSLRASATGRPLCVVLGSAFSPSVVCSEPLGVSGPLSDVALPGGDGAACWISGAALSCRGPDNTTALVATGVGGMSACGGSVCYFFSGNSSVVCAALAGQSAALAAGVPSAAAVGVSVGCSLACALTTSGGVSCWGPDTQAAPLQGPLFTPAVRYARVAVGSGTVCAATGQEGAYDAVHCLSVSGLPFTLNGDGTTAVLERADAPAHPLAPWAIAVIVVAAVAALVVPVVAAFRRCRKRSNKVADCGRPPKEDAHIIIGGNSFALLPMKRVPVDSGSAVPPSSDVCVEQLSGSRTPDSSAPETSLTKVDSLPLRKASNLSRSSVMLSLRVDSPQPLPSALSQVVIPLFSDARSPALELQQELEVVSRKEGRKNTRVGRVPLGPLDLVACGAVDGTLYDTGALSTLEWSRPAEGSPYESCDASECSLGTALSDLFAKDCAELGLALDTVRLVKNQRLLDTFCGGVRAFIAEKEQPVFIPQSPDQELVLSRLTRRLLARDTPQCSRSVRCALVWFGCTCEVAEEVCSGVLRHMRGVTGGKFGAGFYCALQPLYAAMCATGEVVGVEVQPDSSGCYALVAGVAFAGRVYPLTRKHNYEAPAVIQPWSISTYNAVYPLSETAKEGDAAALENDSMRRIDKGYGFEAAFVDAIQYDDLVLRKESQFLPIAVLRFGRLAPDQD